MVEDNFVAWLVDAKEERGKAEQEYDAARKRLAAVVKMGVELEGWSVRKIGQVLGLSGARVHQIYKSAGR